MAGMMQSPSHADGSDGKDKDRGDGARKEFNFWTDQEVWFLLDAYEEKWNQLERGNVKSKHWEEIAHRLATHSSGLWVAKTPTQCKNKIEDMKKKYRAEKAMKGSGVGGAPGSYSKWVFFQRMESLLARNGFKSVVGMPGGMDNGEHAQPAVMELDSFNQIESHLHFRQCTPGAATAAAGRIGEKEIEDEDTSFTTPHHHVAKENGSLTSLLDPCSRVREEAVACLDGRGGGGGGGAGGNGGGGGGVGCGGGGFKRRKHAGGASSMNEVVAVMKSFGESLLRIEEAQIQMQREVARLNAEAELRRIEMEAKRAEMMLNTQLQIARLFSSNKPRRKKPVKKAENAGGGGGGGGGASQEMEDP
ncbi:hypothetical protein SELMODRAFT_415699 [Selaginella moellendorffii]|uniref:Myb-like domain-containing protein n=2 Tax=Selaginella moellendorffii TaxID=88036 RepID=D8RWY7_SELML|nr:hypothetical protein SELMODRAFT_415699 [Selaginella moellendorffii]